MKISFAFIGIFLAILATATNAEDESKENLIKKMNGVAPKERMRLRNKLHTRTRIKNANKKRREGVVDDREDKKMLQEKMKNASTVDERKQIMMQYRMKRGAKPWMNMNAYKEFAEKVKDLPQKERLQAKKNFRKKIKEEHMKEQEE